LGSSHLAFVKRIAFWACVAAVVASAGATPPTAHQEPVPPGKQQVAPAPTARASAAPIAGNSTESGDDEKNLNLLGLGANLLSAIGTLLSAIATALAAFYAYRATKTAERAAKTAEKAIVGLDRPYLMIDKPEFFKTREQGFHGPKFEMANFGRSPAVASKLVETLAVHPRKGTPTMPTEREERDLAGIFVGPAASHSLEAGTVKQINQTGDIEGANRLIWMGELEYDDVLGHGYRTLFCYERTRLGWRMTGGKDLNQSRQLDA
jgi:hypothetical protein